MNKDNDFVDVNFEEVEKEIKGEPLFFTTSQVAQIVGVKPSTIRYWSTMFENLLDVQISNRNKQYLKSDIAKLKFIRKLTKEDGMTLQQVQEYVTDKGFDFNRKEVEGNNPLAVQTFTAAMMTEFNNQFTEMKNQIIELQKELQNTTLAKQKEMNDKLKQELVVNVNEIVSEKVDSAIKTIQLNIDKGEIEATKRDTKLIDAMKEELRMTKEKYEIENNKKKKHFWDRWTKSTK